MTLPDPPIAPSRFPARQPVVRHLQLDCDSGRQPPRNPYRGVRPLPENGITEELRSHVFRESHPSHKGQRNSDKGQITIQNP
jgi:hypothetical protein